MYKKIFIFLLIVLILAAICVFVFPKIQNNAITNDEEPITDASQDEESLINTTQTEEPIMNTTQSEESTKNTAKNEESTKNTTQNKESTKNTAKNEESTKNTAQNKESINNNTVQKNPTINSIPNEMPVEWQDNVIFKNYYNKAYEKLKTLTQDEKIGKLFLISYPSSNQVAILKQYQFGGYLFFEKDFRGKTESQVKTMISNLQKVSKVPLLTAADEEGGTVVRISSNTNLAKSKFLSPMDLYQKRRICRNRKRYYPKK